LLGIACLKKFRSSSDIILDPIECNVPREDIGMVWDGLCFSFLLIQKRLFKSYYFFHIVDETKAMSILASRGAELLEELHQKRIEIQENVEKTVLEKLKFKMDKIKANQQRIQGPSYRGPQTHKIGKIIIENALIILKTLEYNILITYKNTHTHTYAYMQHIYQFLLKYTMPLLCHA
jgi:hypothetical protein